MAEHSHMTSEADAAEAGSPRRGQRSAQTDWAGLSQTNNYPSWSQSQEVTSTTSFNNSFQGLTIFPCRKFFLSSQLSPSRCLVSPNGWVSFPSPTIWRQEPTVKNRTESASIWASLSSLPHAVTTLLGPWDSSDRDHLVQPEMAEAFLCSPKGSPRTPSLPTGCCALCKLCLLASFLSYFMHPDGHSGQDLQNSYPFEPGENGKLKIYYPPGKS